ncbi:MAG: hypothetical protein HQ510_06435 [Candidatus Marinimicrobia bacterium]|nr:hypothetical protein [Candidatus Neomarinimicrobiota bacterium]
MNVLVTSIVLFGTAFFVHLVMWRIRHPKSPIRTILLIFFITYIIGTLLIYHQSQSGSGSIISIDSIADILRIFLFYIALTFTYCFVYHSFEDDSPSLFIVLNIWNTHDNGITIDELYDLMPNDVFFKSRIDYLVIEKLAYLKNERYFISKKGLSVLGLFTFLNKLMKQDEIQG